MYISVCLLCFPTRPSVLKTEAALWCEHVCMYVCTSSCILQSLCNLYIIENEGEIVIVQDRLNWLHGNYYVVCSFVLFFSYDKEQKRGKQKKSFNSERK